MDNCKTRSGLLVHLRKLLPTVILIGLTALAGGTNVFSSTVHALVSKSLTERFGQMLPHLLTMLMVATAVNIAWLAYSPLSCALARAVERWSPREDLKSFALNAFRLVFWGAVLYFTVAFFAPDLMGKLAQGMLFLLAALGVALQNQVGDLCCGLLLRLPNCLAEGDRVRLKNGEDSEGTVVEIGYMRTVIAGDDGPKSIRNSTIWNANIGHPKADSPAPGQGEAATATPAVPASAKAALAQAAPAAALLPAEQSASGDSPDGAVGNDGSPPMKTK